MKIAVAANGPDLDASVCERFGRCPYILIIDTKTMEFEAKPASSLGRPEAPQEVAASILNTEVKTIIVGFMSPRLAIPLAGKGFEVVTGVRGKVEDVIRTYLSNKAASAGSPTKVLSLKGKTREDLRVALKTTGAEFLSIIPVLVTVILLIGLSETFMNRKFLLSIFSGEPLRDSLMGAFWGSILIGNPVNSYVIGDVLLKNGVSLYAVASFLTTWITVGFIQLPVEMDTLGARFAIARTLASVVVSVVVAYLTVVVLQIF